MKAPYPFDFHQSIEDVIVVGLGGTGSQTARSVCRIVYDLRQRGQHTPTLKFVDPDVVEAKNVGRQMFTGADIGQPKASVLAARFNLALGLSIVAYCEPFDAKRHTRPYGTLVVGCVDNHLARLALSQVHGLWLDCGNDRTSGQVCLGNTNDAATVRQCMARGQYPYLPNAALLFPQLLQPDQPVVAATPVTPAPSCADLMDANAQSLLVNDQMGIIAAEYLYKLLNHRPVLSFVTFVDTEALSMRSIPITADNVAAYLGQ